MKASAKLTTRLAIGTLVGVAVIRMQPCAWATSNTWATAGNVTGLWSAASNWSPSAVPNSADAMVIANLGTTINCISILDQAVALGKLSAGETRDTWTILATNANALTFQVTSGTALLYSGYRANLTVNPSIVLNSPLLVSNKSDTACSVILNGAISGTGDVTVGPVCTSGQSNRRSYMSLTNVNSVGAVFVGGSLYRDIVFQGPIGANVAKLDLSGFDTNATVTLASTNAYGGNTTLSGGTLLLGKATSLSTGMLIVSSGTVQATADLSGPNALSNTVKAAGDFTVGGANNIEFAGNLDLGGGKRQFTISNTGLTAFSGIISNDAGGGIVKLGTGSLAFTNVNTYSGPTTVSNGELRIADPSCLGTTVRKALVAPAAALGLSTSINPGTDGANIVDPSSSGLLAIDCTNFSANLDQSKIGNGQMFIGSSVGGAVVAGTWAPGADGTYRIGGGVGKLELDTTSTLSGTNGAQVGGYVVVKANQTITGPVTILTNGTVEVLPNGDAQALAAASSLTINAGGTFRWGTGSGSMYDQSVKALFGNGTLLSWGSWQYLYVTGPGDSAFSGTVTVQQWPDRLGLIKSGSGTFRFSGNMYTYRGVIVNAGTLQLGKTAAFHVTNSLGLNGGTFDLAGYSQQMAGLSSTNPLALLTNSVSTTVSTLTLSLTAIQTNYASLRGAIALAKLGPSVQILGAPNTYSSGTSVGLGTLKLTNSATLGSGPVTLLATATNGAALDLSGLTNAVGGYVSAIANAATLSMNVTNISSTTCYVPMAFGAKGFTNRVAKLMVNGVQQSTGIYTSSNLPLYITGAGAIRVTGAVSGTAVLVF